MTDLKANQQRLFERTVRGLAAQGWERAADYNGDCRYRSYGMKCAAGHLIDDEHYRPSMEGCAITAFYKDDRGVEAAIAASNDLTEDEADLLRPFLRDMQYEHDTADCADAVRAGFQRLAAKHGLSWPSDVK